MKLFSRKATSSPVPVEPRTFKLPEAPEPLWPGPKSDVKPPLAPTQYTPVAGNQELPAPFNPQPFVGSIPEAQIAAPQTVASNSKHKLNIFTVLAVSGLAILVVGGLIVLLVSISIHNNPEYILQRALISSLTTKEYEVQTTGQGLSKVTDYDLRLSNNPVISTLGSLRFNGSIFGLEGYGNMLDTEVKYTSLPNDQSLSLRSAVLNKWIFLRTDSNLPTGVNSNLAEWADPRTQLLGPLVLADLPLYQAQNYVNYILHNNIYSYNTKAIERYKVDNQQIIVYPITFNLAALKSLNQSVAIHYGLSIADINTANEKLKNLAQTSGKLYINATTNDIYRLDLFQNGLISSSTFSHYNILKLPPQPVPSLDWQMLAPLQAAIEQQAALTQTNSQLDSERIANITIIRRYIENYHIKSDNYPTLADLNDQLWISTNMQGINPDVFKDPKGSNLIVDATPTPNAFAYIPSGSNSSAPCDNDMKSKLINPCEHYKLIATLSSGKTYELDNLN